MADQDLQALPSLSARQKALLRRAGLQTPAELLLPPLAAVTAKLQPISPTDVRALLTAVESDAVPPIERVGARARASRHAKGKARARADDDDDGGGGVLGLGDEELDRVLGGGLQMDGSITEIAGESSAGKTQLALAFTVRAALLAPSPPASAAAAAASSSSLPGATTEDGSHAVYLSSEGHLPTPRLISLLPSSVDPAAVLSRIHFLAPTSLDALLHVLAYLLPGLLARIRASGGRTRLIVLDSLAALVRSSFGADRQGLAERSKALCAVADRLRAVGGAYGCAVVVVNQVADVFGDNPWTARSPLDYASPASSASFGSSPAPSQQLHPTSQLHPPASQLGRPSSPSPFPSAPPAPNLAYGAQTRFFSGSSATVRKEAALGLVWANSVTTRLMLGRTDRFVPVAVRGLAGGVEEEDEGGKLRIRRVECVFSPVAGRSETTFVVQTSRVASVRTLKGEDGGGSAGGRATARGAGDGVKRGRTEEGRTDDDVERAKARRKAAVLGLAGPSQVPSTAS